MEFAIPAVPYERPAESSTAEADIEMPAVQTRAYEFGTEPPVGIQLAPGIGETLTSGIGKTLTSAPRDTPAAGTLSGASVVGPDVTVHQVRLGPNVQEITVAKSAGVQVGNHNRQLNQYQFSLDRPQMSLEHLLDTSPSALRSFERLVVNPDSWMANYVFRHNLSAGPARPGNGVLFADASRAPTMRISAHVDEHGTTVVEKSRGVQVGDHNTMRNEFSYKLTRQEISLERMLHDHAGLARSLAMAVRHPDNPAVHRSFTHQVSDAYAHGGAPSLRTLNQDLPGPRVSVEGAVGVQAGIGNTRTDRLSVDIRRMTLTGWESTAERIAAKIDEPAPAPQVVDGPDAAPGRAAPPAAPSAPGTSWPILYRHHPPDPVPDVGDLGPSIGPAF